MEEVDLIGYKDGIPTHLGKIPMPPKMKLKEIVSQHLGSFDDGDEFQYEEQHIAMAMGEEFLSWLIKQGWGPKQNLSIDKVRENLNQIIGGMHDQTPTRRIYVDNPDAIEADQWWENYCRRTHDNVKNVARSALKDLE